jgi:hypothetical protein
MKCETMLTPKEIRNKEIREAKAMKAAMKVIRKNPIIVTMPDNEFERYSPDYENLDFLKRCWSSVAMESYIAKFGTPPTASRLGYWDLGILDEDMYFDIVKMRRTRLRALIDDWN